MDAQYQLPGKNISFCHERTNRQNDRYITYMPKAVRALVWRDFCGSNASVVYCSVDFRVRGFASFRLSESFKVCSSFRSFTAGSVLRTRKHNRIAETKWRKHVYYINCYRYYCGSCCTDDYAKRYEYKTKAAQCRGLYGVRVVSASSSSGPVSV